MKRTLTSLAAMVVVSAAFGQSADDQARAERLAADVKAYDAMKLDEARAKERTAQVAQWKAQNEAHRQTSDADMWFGALGALALVAGLAWKARADRPKSPDNV